MLKHFLGIRCVWPKNLEFRKFKKLFFFHFSVFIYNYLLTFDLLYVLYVVLFLTSKNDFGPVVQWSLDYSEVTSASPPDLKTWVKGAAALSSTCPSLLCCSLPGHQEGRRPISPVRCISPASVRHKCSSWRKKLLRQCEIHQTLPVCDLSRGAMGFAPTWVFGKNDWV